ncbi:L-threonine aldolase [Sediminihabitans luteus]|uniref:L-threonine aldolase n=1 Tax=Sediminihabitans luteus TaxID=1138585 RepID=A0A2M9CBY7_9CELL|nr:beta-eliminating lyase-related protein [Sediminihabitans luteus]PJJ68556.1 L-threonine aldolase [Sediminihabitans luteus]GII99891.1 threonine aldolase [Sediminihabitans luteus]
MTLRSFGSDNHAGIHPEVLAAIAAANTDHALAYGDDPWTARLAERVRETFGPEASVTPVFNGTGANVVGLTSLLPRWGAVICSELAHVHTDEQGAPERVGGLKLLPVPSPDGRITPDAVHAHARALGDVHHPQPLAVLVTQSTELGTVYRPDELRALADAAHGHGMALFVDGARLANAAAALGLPLRAITTDVGVDAVSFGGTKNGALAAEAVVVLRPGVADGIGFVRKAQMQLASKMRFVSAQLLAQLGEPGDPLGATAGAAPLWLRTASHANAMTALLRSTLEDDVTAGRVQHLGFAQPSEANATFAVLPRAAADALREHAPFYEVATGPEPGTVVSRWMTAWDTTPHEVGAFCAAVREVLGR